MLSAVLYDEQEKFQHVQCDVCTSVIKSLCLSNYLVLSYATRTSWCSINSFEISLQQIDQKCDYCGAYLMLIEKMYMTTFSSKYSQI